MDIDEVESQSSDIYESYITPGQEITSNKKYLRGHGTYFVKNSLVASQAGKVIRINNLISVKPTTSTYKGEVGDVIIGRIAEVESTRWKVDVKGQKYAVLQLGSVSLPDGELRRTTNQDAMQMRKLYKEGDILSAEIIKTMEDGRVNIQTRSLKYGLLSNGLLISVEHNLIKRVKNHFVSLSLDSEEDIFIFGTFGLNGNIFLSPKLGSIDARRDLSVTQKSEFYRTKVWDVSVREELAKVRNCIKLLESKRKIISPEVVKVAYRIVKENSIEAKFILLPSIAEKILGAI
eukprot:maker-scaffold_11-snap-gene-12.2-mRNA-1 protein AED:0.02 eAED:0.02 QI:60/1/1/1/1/1/3/740/289